MDLTTLRTALIVTLSILLLVLVWRRMIRWMRTRDVPAPLHAELLDLEVAYHPSVLHLRMKLPLPQAVRLSLLNERHGLVQRWPEEHFAEGLHTLHLDLPVLADGNYHVELSTGTQRTVRLFRLNHA